MNRHRPTPPGLRIVLTQWTKHNRGCCLTAVNQGPWSCQQSIGRRVHRYLQLPPRRHTSYRPGLAEVQLPWLSVSLPKHGFPGVRPGEPPVGHRSLAPLCCHHYREGRIRYLRRQAPTVYIDLPSPWSKHSQCATSTELPQSLDCVQGAGGTLPPAPLPLPPEGVIPPTPPVAPDRDASPPCPAIRTLPPEPPLIPVAAPVVAPVAGPVVAPVPPLAPLAHPDVPPAPEPPDCRCLKPPLPAIVPQAPQEPSGVFTRVVDVHAVRGDARPSARVCFIGTEPNPGIGVVLFHAISPALRPPKLPP